MSKRGHADVFSPRSDSDNDDFHVLVGAEPPLLPLRPPSVTGSDHELTFGGVVDGVPVSLPVPRLPDVEQSEKSHHSLLQPTSVSPTAVSATPLGRHGSATDATAALDAIPEGEDADAEAERPSRASRSPSTPSSGDAGAGGRDPDRGSESDSRTPSPAPPPEHAAAGAAAAAAPPFPPPMPWADELAESEGVAPSTLKRRKASHPVDDRASASPERRKCRVQPPEEEETEPVGDESPRGGEEEAHRARLRAHTAAALAAGSVGGEGGSPYRLHLEVELPHVDTSVRFAAADGTPSAEPPFYPLRPPSVSGCPEPLRFGDDGPLPLPARAAHAHPDSDRDDGPSTPN